MESRVKLSIVKSIALAAALVVAVSGCGSDGAVDLSSANIRVPHAAYLPTHFPVLPPVGLQPSTPTTGKWVIDVLQANSEWMVYPDGRVFTGATGPWWGSRWVEQRLTRRGVQLLQSTILATGLFQQHDLILEQKHQDWGYRVRTHGRTFGVSVKSSPPSHDDDSTMETPAQARALARIDALFVGSTRRLPAWAWADRTIRPWIPAYYIISHDRNAPDPSRLPPPANAALAQYTDFLRTSVQAITTSQARALLQAFQKAGIAPAINNVHFVFYDFAGLRMLPGGVILYPASPAASPGD